mmetsp:Transcript_89585/g.252519  ORF Transcript_89585/g.252519 Transcript_89585/m.252519 type:complete len:252 (+) Transcript_89585:628-1383(+)
MRPRLDRGHVRLGFLAMRVEIIHFGVHPTALLAEFRPAVIELRRRVLSCRVRGRCGLIQLGSRDARPCLRHCRCSLCAQGARRLCEASAEVGGLTQQFLNGRSRFIAGPAHLHSNSFHLQMLVVELLQPLLRRRVGTQHILSELAVRLLDRAPQVDRKRFQRVPCAAVGSLQGLHGGDMYLPSELGLEHVNLSFEAGAAFLQWPADVFADLSRKVGTESGLDLLGTRSDLLGHTEPRLLHPGGQAGLDKGH